MALGTLGDRSLPHVYQDTHRFEVPRCTCSSVYKVLGKICNPGIHQAYHGRGRRAQLTQYGRWQGMQLDHVLDQQGPAGDALRQRYSAALNCTC